MKRKKPSFISRFLSALRDYVPFFIFLSLAGNVFVVYRYESSRRPQVVYSVERVFVNTNTTSSATSPDSGVKSIPPPPSSPVSVPSSNVVSRTVCNAEYDYFLYNGVRGVKMWDRFYNEGSLTSFGRISKIFPDRILLEDGGYIVNSKWLSVSSIKPQPEKKGVL